MNYVLLLIGGALLCNGIPHLVSGLQERRSRPCSPNRGGVGNSPPLVNFVWGAANSLIGLAMLSNRMAAAEFSLDFLAFAAGFLAVGACLSLHFGKVRR